MARKWGLCNLLSFELNIKDDEIIKIANDIQKSAYKYAEKETIKKTFQAMEGKATNGSQY